MDGYGQVSDSDTLAQPSSTPRALSFDCRRRQFARLLLRNLLLTLVTLGIYRFWAKTRVRLCLWRHLKLLDEPLEYLGTGTELLVGFLTAVAVLVPLTGSYSLLPLLVPDSFPYQGLVLQALYYIVLGFVVQMALYRVQRYRLTRTAWRGVRSGLEGSSFRYALIWYAYGLATLATLGLAYPWLRVATTRYFASHARFGSTRVSFDGRVIGLFLRWLVVLTPALATIALLAVINGEAFLEELARLRGNLDRTSARQSVAAVLRFNYYPLWLLLPSFILGIWYRVNEFRYLIGAVRIGETRLDSRLETPTVYIIYILFYICVVGAVLFLWFGIIAGVLTVLHVSGLSGGYATTMVLLGSSVFAYSLYGFARRLFVEITLLKTFCATLMLERPEALEQTVQSSAALPGHGEGLADALDVGGF